MIYAIFIKIMGAIDVMTLGTPFIVVYKQLNTFLSHELAETEITATELLYLALLYAQDARTQDEFCSAYCVDKAAAARTIQHMETKGLVTRSKDETDRRANRVCLTDKARKYEPVLQRIRREWISAVTKGLSPDDVLSFEKTLTHMAENVRALNEEVRS